MLQLRDEYPHGELDPKIRSFACVADPYIKEPQSSFEQTTERYKCNMTERSPPQKAQDKTRKAFKERSQEARSCRR
jgi:hypothetical protein